MTHHPIPPTMQKIGTLLRSGSDYGFLVRDTAGLVHFHVAFTDHELDPLPVTVDPLAPLEQHATEWTDSALLTLLRRVWGDGATHGIAFQAGADDSTISPTRRDARIAMLRTATPSTPTEV